MAGFFAADGRTVATVIIFEDKATDNAREMIREQVWRVSPFDPLSFSVVVLILVTAGLMACLWPALRAARLNPMVALRHE